MKAKHGAVKKAEEPTRARPAPENLRRRLRPLGTSRAVFSDADHHHRARAGARRRARVFNGRGAARAQRRGSSADERNAEPSRYYYPRARDAFTDRSRRAAECKAKGNPRGGMIEMKGKPGGAKGRNEISGPEGRRERGQRRNSGTTLAEFAALAVLRSGGERWTQ
jgi:hypothetical protein